MRIENHMLVGAPYAPDNMGGPLEVDAILVHYTATRNGPATVRSLQHETRKASVHFVVHPDAAVTQMVPCNRIAWHAGESSWNGRTSCSNFMVGIEIVNPGPLESDGKTLVIERNPQRALYPWAKPWDGGVVEARHKNGGPYRFWCAYPDEQIKAVAQLCAALQDAYAPKNDRGLIVSLLPMVGHDDVAPKRKIDPGPAWPWESFRRRVEDLSLHGAELARRDGEP